MAIGPVDIEFVVKGNVDAQLKRVSQTVAGESKALQAQVANFGKTFSDTYDKSASSIAAMKERLEGLKKIYSELSEEGRKSEFGKIVGGNIQRMTADIEKAEAANKSFITSLKEAPGALGSTVSSIEQMTKAALRFIATPIGAVITAIVVALKALTSWFKSSEEGENALALATSVFKQVMESLIDPIEDVGEWLWKAFTRPKDALRDLVDFLKGQLTYRLEAFGKIGAAVQQIFKGEVGAGMAELTNAMGQLATGIEDPAKKMAAYLNEAVEKTKQRVALTEQQNILEAKQRDWIVERERISKDIAKLQLDAWDESRGPEAQRAALLKATNLYKKMGDQDIYFANEKLRITKSIKGLDDQTKADKEELANLEADVIRKQGEVYNNMRSLQRRINSLGKQAAKEDVDAATELKNQIEALNKELLSADDGAKKAIADKIVLLQKELQLRLDSAEAALKVARGDQENIIPKGEKKAVPLLPESPKEIPSIVNNLEKVRKKNQEAYKWAKLLTNSYDDETVKKFANTVDQVLGMANELTQQFSEQLGLNEEQTEALGKGFEAMSGIADIASGNVLQGAYKIVSSMVSMFVEAFDEGTLSERFENLQKQVEKTINSLQIAKVTLGNLGETGVTRQLAVIESQLKTVGKEAATLNKDLAGKQYGPRRSYNTTVYKDLTQQVVDLEKEIEALTNKLLSGKLSDEQRKAIEAVLQSYNSLISQLNDITQEITGTTVQALADSLADAFLAGEDAAESWGQKVDDIIKYIIKKQLTTSLLVGPVQKAIDQLVKDTENGLTPAEADAFKKTIESITSSVAPAFAAAKDALKAMGIDLGASSTDASGMTGGIQNIQEETAGIIAGYMLGIKTDIRVIIAEIVQGQVYMNQGLSYLSEIATNTRYNAKLKDIDEGIKEMNRIMKERL